MKCWICQINEANSEEHRFKASDIRRNFGRSFDATYYNGDQTKNFSSDNDKILKFPKVICIDCNNNRTRNADNAYTHFFENIGIVNLDIETTGIIDYRNLFGDGWKTKSIDLYRYIAKHAGCKIVTSEFKDQLLVQPLSWFILGATNIDNFFIKIYYNELTKKFSEHLNSIQKNKFKKTLAFGDTIFLKNDSNIVFAGKMMNGSIVIEWYYGNKIPFKKAMNFDTPLIKVGTLDIENHYPRSFNDFEEEEFVSYLNFGKYHLNRELEKEHYKKAFNDLYLL